MSLPTLRRALLRGSAVTAALFVALAALLAVPLATASSAYAAPTHVAIVIAGGKSACVPWQSGMTGDSLLHEVASVTYNASHMINRIDGRPSDGASSVSSYWAYWHDTGSGWTYSSVGASDYSVPAGSVEGWIFGDGSYPPSGSYASICAGQDPVTPVAPAASAAQPPATPAKRPAGGSTPAQTAGTATGGVGTGSASGAAGSTTAGSTAVGAARSSAARASVKPSARPARSTAGSPAVAPATAAAAPTSSTRTDLAVPGRPGGTSSAGSAIGAAVAALAVAALAGGAVWARRRRRAG